jgi:glycosyltransferase involved in cell wall biosynthesis
MHESGLIDVHVLYCSRQNLKAGTTDTGFGREVVWDIPLLEGYPHRFLTNLGGERGVHGMFSIINPGVVTEILGGRYDAVLVHGHSHFTTLLAVAAAKLSGTAVLMRAETHLLLQHRGWKRWLRGPVMRAYYALCDACLYLGERNREFYLAHGVTEERLFPVPYAVDNERFAADAARADTPVMRQSLGIDPDTPVVLYASKLMKRKRPADLLEAYARLRHAGVRAALLFVGDGDERASLEQEVASRKIPDVRFVGFKNQGELPALYALADVFVLPSEGEPWGLVINEVMAAGVPVITTSEVGAAADLVRDGETGFQYAVGDINALAERLRAILEDSALRSRMSSASVRRMESWSYRECVAGISAALARRSRRLQRRMARGQGDSTHGAETS